MVIPPVWKWYGLAGAMYAAALWCFVASQTTPGQQPGLVVAAEVLAGLPTFWLIVRRRWPWVP